MSFLVPAEAYDRFMGRYSSLLSAQVCELAGIAGDARVLDVGCGTGALTAELVERVGQERVSAVDPSEPFVATVRSRLPAVHVRRASAERLPFPDASFDATLAQLVVHFLADPASGVAEMRRVTREGGVVAACVWDYAGGRGPLSPFWEAARALDPGVEDESGLPGARSGDLGRLLREAGLDDVEETALVVAVEHESFEEWWQPFTLGVGPAGAYVAGLDADARQQLREECATALPDGPFVLTSHAWAARGVV